MGTKTTSTDVILAMINQKLTRDTFYENDDNCMAELKAYAEKFGVPYPKGITEEYPKGITEDGLRQLIVNEFLDLESTPETRKRIQTMATIASLNEFAKRMGEFVKRDEAMTEE